MTRTQWNRGFTLLEVLIAMSLVSIVLGIMVTFSGTMGRFTGLTTAVSQSLTELADAEGYVSDQLRSAKMIRGSTTLLNPDGSVLIDCQLINGLCIGLVVPVVDTVDDSQPIVDFDLVVFAALEGNPFADVGVRAGVDGARTLVEYRRPALCPVATCANVSDVLPAGSADLTPAQRTISDPPGYIIGNLIVDEEDVFERDFLLDDFNLVVNFVVQANAAAGQPFVVSRNAVALQVNVRD